MHGTVAQALTVLRNLDHRGAKGSDPETGDGAGILTQIPDELLRAVLRLRAPAARPLRRGPGLPAAGRAATAQMQADRADRAARGT